jgi:hypothetical protein
MTPIMSVLMCDLTTHLGVVVSVCFVGRPATATRKTGRSQETLVRETNVVHLGRQVRQMIAVQRLAIRLARVAQRPAPFLLPENEALLTPHSLKNNLFRPCRKDNINSRRF